VTCSDFPFGSDRRVYRFYRGILTGIYEGGPRTGPRNGKNSEDNNRIPSLYRICSAKIYRNRHIDVPKSVHQAGIPGLATDSRRGRHAARTPALRLCRSAPEFSCSQSKPSTQKSITITLYTTQTASAAEGSGEWPGYLTCTTHPVNSAKSTRTGQLSNRRSYATGLLKICQNQSWRRMVHLRFRQSADTHASHLAARPASSERV